MKKLVETIKNPQILLKEVTYKWFPITVNDEQLKVSAKDSFDTQIDNNNNLLVSIRRSVFVDPPQLFSIDIEYNIIWEIEEVSADDIREQLSELTDDDKNFMCFTAKNECSLLIAQLTKAANLPPLWTPNDLLLKE
jgi:hypothetical protein